MDQARGNCKARNCQSCRSLGFACRLAYCERRQLFPLKIAVAAVLLNEFNPGSFTHIVNTFHNTANVLAIRAAKGRHNNAVEFVFLQFVRCEHILIRVHGFFDRDEFVVIAANGQGSVRDTVCQRDSMPPFGGQRSLVANRTVTEVLWNTFLFVFAATGAFAELKDSLDTIWEEKVKPGIGLWIALKTRLLSLAVVVGTGFLLMVSLLLTAMLTALTQWLGRGMPVTVWSAFLLDLIVSFVVITFLFALIFKLLPDVSLSWRDVWIGSVTTSVLFMIGKSLID